MDEQAKVSIAVLDSALTHLQEANKRLARLLALALIVLSLVFGGILYFLMYYDVITSDVNLDAYDGPANYIGNDGDINNGSH